MSEEPLETGLASGKYKDLTFTVRNMQERPWGYENLTTFVDIEKNEHNVVLLFRTKPTEENILNQVSFWGDKIIPQSLQNPDENEMLLKSEVEEILRLKGYLTANQKFEDLLYKKAKA